MTHPSDEPVGYDGFGAPVYDLDWLAPDYSFVEAFPRRFMAGVDQATIVWGQPASLSIAFDAESMSETIEAIRLLIGDPTFGLVPLCDQKIPARGAE